jgi:hypothetical protein
MADDLGDSHTNSLMQGGAIPTASTNFRTAGRVFADAGKPITYILYPEDATKGLYIGLFNAAGTTLSSQTGTGTLTGTYTPTTTGWITVKVRHAAKTNPMQRCWVNVTYTAPAVLTNANTARAVNTSSVWSANGGSSEWMCAENWEDGLVPSAGSDVVIPGNAYPPPCVSGSQRISSLLIEDDAEVCLDGELEISNTFENRGEFTGHGVIINGVQRTSVGLQVGEFSVYPNPSSDQVTLLAADGFDRSIALQAELFDMQGRRMVAMQGNLDALSEQLSSALADVNAGVYFLYITGSDTKVVRISRN